MCSTTNLLIPDTKISAFVIAGTNVFGANPLQSLFNIYNEAIIEVELFVLYFYLLKKSIFYKN
jgi:hypothetical protein